MFYLPGSSASSRRVSTISMCVCMVISDVGSPSLPGPLHMRGANFILTQQTRWCRSTTIVLPIRKICICTDRKPSSYSSHNRNVKQSVSYELAKSPTSPPSLHNHHYSVASSARQSWSHFCQREGLRPPDRRTEYWLTGKFYLYRRICDYKLAEGCRVTGIALDLMKFVFYVN